MLCKYCGEPLPAGTHGKREYCSDAHKQAYFREKSQEELQAEIKRLKEHVTTQQQEIEHLKDQTRDLEQENEQLHTVIIHLKHEINLEQRYLNDTQARGFLAFIRKRPPTPLIEKLLADRSIFDRGGRWYFETHIRFRCNGSEEEILEFKDLWKLLMLETSRDDF